MRKRGLAADLMLVSKGFTSLFVHIYDSNVAWVWHDAPLCCSPLHRLILKLLFECLQNLYLNNREQLNKSYTRTQTGVMAVPNASVTQAGHETAIGLTALLSH